MSSAGLSAARTRRIVLTRSASPSSAKRITVQGNEDRVGRDERVQRKKAERRWAVDEDVVVSIAHARDQKPQSFFPLGQRDELDFGAGQAAIGWHELGAVRPPLE